MRNPLSPSTLPLGPGDDLCRMAKMGRDREFDARERGPGHETGLTWCKGKTTPANGKKISWDDFITYMESR